MKDLSTANTCNKHHKLSVQYITPSRPPSIHILRKESKFRESRIRCLLVDSQAFLWKGQPSYLLESILIQQKWMFWRGYPAVSHSLLKLESIYFDFWNKT
ncbi:hypothetical protein UPYG_G00108270 [Umbra pygmaea]|uniref:Ycf15 n=1 Tax=Umbra pygmaea TaxID=75934 RepID=A0ABD0XML7_UMBPY